MAGSSPKDSFNYVYSSDVKTKIQFKIGTLEGTRERPTPAELKKDVTLLKSGACDYSVSLPYMEYWVVSRGHPDMCKDRTKMKPYQNNRVNWDEWVTLPLKYSDIGDDSYLVFTIYDVHNPDENFVVGGTSISLFGEDKLFRQGIYDLKVWQRQKGDGSAIPKTPGLSKDNENDQMSRFLKLLKLHRNGQIPQIGWMDRLTFRDITIKNEIQKRETKSLYLTIKFPEIHCRNVHYNIVYFELEAELLLNPHKYGEIIRFEDPGLDEVNLAEEKHYMMTRGRDDRDKGHGKPNTKERDRLNVLISYPPTENLTSEDKDLIWKYRKTLSAQNKALAKFLRSVHWQKEDDVTKAIKLLLEWSPMESQDALELLTKDYSHPIVRKYAVARLNETKDEDLILYVLELVQALNFEKLESIASLESHVLAFSSSSTFSRATDSYESAQTTSTNARDFNSTVSNIQSTSTTSNKLPDNYPQTDLTTFLIRRACRNSKLANYIYWYLKVECGDEESMAKNTEKQNKYKTVLSLFTKALDEEGKQELHSTFTTQEQLLERIVNIMKAVERETGNRLAKIKKLQSFLKDKETGSICLLNFDPIPLPLDPDVLVKGIDPETATLFKSARTPCRLTFKTINNKEYVTIFKHGDDLRQDQLVLQIIHLIDRLLKKENLDLKLTPYKVLATSSKHGFVQCIDSVSVSDILNTDGSILNYFKKIAPADNAPLGVKPEVLDNYIRSCAGYCVITYILLVGDRHFDNLLITRTGKLFHIDFGFILGRDPKPMMQPSIKLSREMVDAMGGVTSDHFADFKQFCYTAFLHLRRSSNLILNLFSLMEKADIPDIALEPDKTVKKVQDRFHLDLNDEEAVRYMQKTLDESLSAFFPALMEQMHKVSQLLKK